MSKWHNKPVVYDGIKYKHNNKKIKSNIMEFKKKTIIWEDNNEPPKNYIWVKSDKNAYEFNHTTRQWEKIMSSNGNGSGDSENNEELDAFMEFFDGLDNSFKKLPTAVSIDEYNNNPLPEQYELFGNKEAASQVLVFVNVRENTEDYVVAFVSDDLCNKLIGWCFNYCGDDSDNEHGSKFNSISLSSQGVPFLVADKLPLLIEKCVDSNELIDIPQGRTVRFMYKLVGGPILPLNCPYTLFPINSSEVSDVPLVVTFEENSKTYYAPGILTQVLVG